MCCSQITILQYVIPKKEDTPSYKICSSNSTINAVANSNTRCTKSAHTMVYNILIQVFMYVSFCSSAPEPFSFLLVQPFGLTSSFSSIISDPEKSEGERIT